MVDGKRCKVDALPSVVKGDLDLYGCDVKSLPEGLTVGGSLYLIGCTGLTALPDGLTVGVHLDLYGCTGLSGVKIPAGVNCEVYR